MNMIDELVKFSNKYGSNPELVLAGGGNTSAKADGRMWVKGSGTALATITADGFVEMELLKLNEIFNKTYPDSDDEREALVLADLMAARAASSADKRPSVETTLHALFEQKYVLHLHPTLINGVSCSREGESAAKRTIKHDFIWIDQCRPGYMLAKLCSDKMNEYKKLSGKACDMLLLANHGIFIAGETVEELGEKLTLVLDGIGAAAKEQPAGQEDIISCTLPEKISAAFGDNVSVYSASAPFKNGFLNSRESAAPLMTPFTPDHVVYCRAFPLWLDSAEDAAKAVEDYKTEYGYAPRVILLRGVGAYCVGDNEKQALTAAKLLEDAVKIAVYARSFGGACSMGSELTDFIANWEVESYRSSQNG